MKVMRRRHEAHERPLTKAVQVNLGLPWRPLDARRIRALQYLKGQLHTKIQGMEPVQEEKNTSGSKAGREDPSMFSDNRHDGVTGYGVCTAGLQSSSGPVFLHYALVPPC